MTNTRKVWLGAVAAEMGIWLSLVAMFSTLWIESSRHLHATLAGAFVFGMLSFALFFATHIFWD